MKGPVAASLRRSASRPASCLFFGVFVGFIDTKVTYLVFLGKKKSRPKKISSARFWISPIPPVRPSEGAGFESEEFQIRNRRRRDFPHFPLGLLLRTGYQLSQHLGFE